MNIQDEPLLDRLNQIYRVKSSLYEALRDKHVDIDIDETPFSEYPSCISNIDCNKNLERLLIYIQPTEPVSTDGGLWIDTSNNTYKVYDFFQNEWFEIIPVSSAVESEE